MKVGHKARHGRTRHPVPHKSHRTKRGVTKDSLIRQARLAWRTRKVRALEAELDREMVR